MVDQLILDAWDKLDEFGEAWVKRQEEMAKAGVLNAKLIKDLEDLRFYAYEAELKMGRALKLDKQLDKVYDKLKEKRKLKV